MVHTVLWNLLGPFFLSWEPFTTQGNLLVKKNPLILLESFQISTSWFLILNLTLWNLLYEFILVPNEPYETFLWVFKLELCSKWTLWNFFYECSNRILLPNECYAKFFMNVPTGSWLQMNLMEPFFWMFQLDLGSK